ncbi:MAG: amidohydrolase [Thermoplasmatota archaeon]
MAPDDNLSRKTIDLHFRNGHIWDSTGMGFRKGELVLVDGMIEQIAFGGSADVRHPTGTETFDLEGGYVSPGFIDGHMHLLQWSISRSGLDLSRCRSLKEIVGMIRAVADGIVENELFSLTGIVMGTDIDDSHFPTGGIGDNGFLEEEFPDIPVIARRVCGHKAVANGQGLDVLGVGEDEHRKGLLLEELAMEVPWHLPIPDEVLGKLFRQAVNELYGQGVVGGVDIVPMSRYEVLRDVHEGSGIVLRSSVSMIRDGPFSRPGPDLSEKDRKPFSDPGKDDDRLRLRFEKFFLDGSIGARTASFDRDYLDSPRFPLLHTDRELGEMLMRSYGDGLVPMVHCIGDAAISQAIRVLEEIGGPYRLEHAEAITDEHLERMRAGKGSLCLQPNFQHIWGRKGGLYEKGLGRSDDLNRLRSIVGSGVPWCFGTDMMPASPLFTFKGGLEHPVPSQRLQLWEMVEGFTKRSARLSLLEAGWYGDMMVGSRPDIAVLTKDLSSVSATMIGGRMVFEGPPSSL